MVTTEKKPVGHILLLPYPSQGHINPMLQFGKRIASHGRLATAAITRFVAATTTPEAGPVALETISDGFDDGGFASAACIPAYLAGLESAGSQTLDNLLKSLADRGQPVSILVYDAFLPWAVEVALRHGVAAAAFFTQSVAVDVIYCHVWEGRLKYPVAAVVEELPGLPRMEPEELPSLLEGPMVTYVAYLELVLNQYKNLDKAEMMLVNSFYELESKQEGSTELVRTVMMKQLPGYNLGYNLEGSDFPKTGCRKMCRLGKVVSFLYKGIIYTENFEMRRDIYAEGDKRKKLEK